MSIEKANMKPIFDFIPEKPAQRFGLEMRARPIITRNFDVLPDLAASARLLPFDDVYVEVSYDGQILGQLRLTSNESTTWNLLDDKDILTHEISFCLKGKQNGHSADDQGQTVTMCAEVDVLIENVPVIDMITGGGLLLLGENDRPSTLSVTTPIYRWLLANSPVFYQTQSQKTAVHI